MRWASLFPRKQLFRATDTLRFFAIPIVAIGQLTLDTEEHAQLDTVIAASWG